MTAADEGKSGTTIKNRNEYQRLLNDMEEKKFDVLVVKSQDRLQRNPRDWYIFVDKLNSCGIKLYFYLDKKYFKCEEDGLITGIKAILASEYSRDLSKKMSNANKRRIEKAKRGEPVSAMGNGQTYGYKISNGKWIVNEDQRTVVSKLYELYAELHSIRKVRNEINLLGYKNQNGAYFTEENISRILHNEMNKGWVVLNRHRRNFETKTIDKLPESEWVIVKGDHEPIVSEELWDTVNNEIISHRNKGHKNKGRRVSTDPLGGKMFCVNCGNTLWRHSTKKYVQWYCGGKFGRGELVCNNPASISGLQIKKYLLQLADEFLDYETIEYSKSLLKQRALAWLKNLKSQLSGQNSNEKIEAEIAQLENKRRKLIDLYTDGLITKNDFVSKNAEIIQTIHDKQAVIEPQTINSDINDIDGVIKNIDKEIDLLFEDKSLVEEKKLQFIIEHTKKIIVLQNKDVFVFLDIVVGAFLFLGGKARINVVPEEAINFNSCGINEDSIIPFDSEHLPQSDGGVHIPRHGG